jgi:hypothetical protein
MLQFASEKFSKKSSNGHFKSKKIRSARANLRPDSDSGAQNLLKMPIVIQNTDPFFALFGIQTRDLWIQIEIANN